MPRKLGTISLFCAVILITALRVSSELLLLYYPFEGHADQTIRFYLENIYYFMIAFLGVSVLVAQFTKENLNSLMNFGIHFFPLIILPPWLDHALGRTDGYHYATKENLWWNVFTFSFVKGDSSIGISIEVILALQLLFVYVFIKTKNVLKSTLATVASYAGLMLLSTPGILFPGEANFGTDMFLQFYYFLPFLAVSAFVMTLQSPGKLGAFFSNLRLLRSLAFVLLVLVGGLTAYFYGYRMHWLKLGYAALVMFLLWEVSVMINDIYDLSIDKISNPKRPLVKGTLSADDYRTASALLTFLALSFALTIHFKAFIITSSCAALAVLYSVPPLRLRKNFLGYAVLSAAMVLAYGLGLVSASYVDVRIDRQVWMFLMLVALYGAIVPMAKDLKDLESDKQHGILNLFTLFGKEKGKRIYAVLFFLTQLTCAFALPGLFPGILILALVATFFYIKTENLRLVYLAGMLELSVVFFLLIGV